MLENFNRWIQEQKSKGKINTLKKVEKEWGLYNRVPKLFMTWLFAFINQRSVGGHFNSSLTFYGDVCENNCTIVINLNKRESNLNVIVHKINHEALHCAIRNCLFNAPSKFSTIDNSFVEKVIDDWMLKQRVVINGFDGDAIIINPPPKI